MGDDGDCRCLLAKCRFYVDKWGHLPNMWWRMAVWGCGAAEAAAAAIRLFVEGGGGGGGGG